MTSQCPHSDTTSRIAIHGTRLVLCPLCWVVIDPSTPTTVHQPAAPKSHPVPVPVLRRPPAPKPLPITLPVHADDFAWPIPGRWKTRFPGTKVTVLFFMFILGIGLSFYAACFYNTSYPKFQEYDVDLDPFGRFAVDVPAPLTWSDVAEVRAERDTMFSHETYQIRVTPLRQSRRFSRLRSPDSRSVAETIMYYNVPVTLHARYDVPDVVAAAEYEQWMTGKLVIVSRVVIVNDLVYEMTVSGQNLSLTDRRVQRFFNSLRPGKRPTS